MAGPSHPSSTWHSWERSSGCLIPEFHPFLSGSSLFGAERGLSGRTGIVRTGCPEEVHWPRHGGGYSKLRIQLLLLRLGCLLPLGPHLNLVIIFAREMDLAFSGIGTLGNLDPFQSGPRLPVEPVGFATGSSVNFCIVGPALSLPCAHLRTEGLAEIEGTEAHGPPGGRNPHTSPKLCHLNIPVQQRSQEFMHPFIYSLVHCLGPTVC